MIAFPSATVPISSAVVDAVVEAPANGSVEGGVTIVKVEYSG